ncbi:MAG: hypothetical protein DWQ07_17290 [Chloroflexi bacterium]|nr:MAG: hypothetical protein DWQ07_17290 [Chloroflexota bacterium]MBL1195161.1 hypothetical protein [Chloroflexota bacterium]NOH12446.1 hypothetical protein [Chloroflexota bacterium]
MTELSSGQLDIAEASLDSKVFLQGVAGTGKTAAGIARLQYLLDQGVQAENILVLVPQRALGLPYAQAVQEQSGTQMIDFLTIGGLARRMVDLYWPLIAEEAGFAQPNEPPIFLTLETAQYYMARIVEPKFEHGVFESVSIPSYRLYSQVIDNLDKAAGVGFPHTEIAARLRPADLEDPGKARVFYDVQSCANEFREYCLAHNLLDFSLQLEVFLEHLWSPGTLCQEYLIRQYTHTIVDNLEEKVPVAHDMLLEWLPSFSSALLIYDQEAGNRRFLGADPDSALRLSESCHEDIEFTESFVMGSELTSFSESLRYIVLQGEAHPPKKWPAMHELETILPYQHHVYFPAMLDWVVNEIRMLVHDQGVSPGEIAVLAPYLSDSLRYSLVERLNNQEISVSTHRPSRSLSEEPVIECLINLAKLAHLGWGYKPTRQEITFMLMQAVGELDLVRAQLLAEHVYGERDGALEAFESISAEIQERVTYQVGERYERLRNWLRDYMATEEEELDFFLSSLFGEVLSQPGFGFHEDYNAGQLTANLIESVQKFRWIAGDILEESERTLGQEYIHMVEQGVIAAQYIGSWTTAQDESVLIAPAYTFLMRNQPVDYQFWLNIGSTDWYQRLYQPLTHPEVLSRRWPEGRKWTMEDEEQYARESMARLTVGLVRRCRKAIYLGLSELNEAGYEMTGDLQKALNSILKRAPRGTL